MYLDGHMRFSLRELDHTGPPMHVDRGNVVQHIQAPNTGSTIDFILAYPTELLILRRSAGKTFLLRRSRQRFRLYPV